MSTFTYALVPANSPKADLLKPFLTYAITTGQKFGAKLAFAPLPAKILTHRQDDDREDRRQLDDAPRRGPAQARRAPSVVLAPLHGTRTRTPICS